MRYVRRYNETNPALLPHHAVNPDPVLPVEEAIPAADDAVKQSN
jgi:hypothetical protein